eukprot:m.124759 g.124759  ORF g.124759 m.124759 type:complete len:217 (-) comp15600_c0_seq3:39-689(-)
MLYFFSVSLFILPYPSNSTCLIGEQPVIYPSICCLSASIFSFSASPFIYLHSYCFIAERFTPFSCLQSTSFFFLLSSSSSLLLFFFSSLHVHIPFFTNLQLTFSPFTFLWHWPSLNLLQLNLFSLFSFSLSSWPSIPHTCHSHSSLFILPSLLTYLSHDRLDFNILLPAYLNTSAIFTLTVRPWSPFFIFIFISTFISLPSFKYLCACLRSSDISA